VSRTPSFPASSDPLAPLQQWVAQQLNIREWQYRQGESLKPLSGDAGFRCYFRVESEPSLLAVFSPPETEDNATFITLARFLRDQGIHAPEIIAADLDQGFMLLEDFGDRLLLGELTSESVDLLYGETMMVLLRLQQCSVAEYARGNRGNKPLPVYDRSKLRQEMELLREWFIPQLLSYELSEAEHSLLDNAFELLENAALEQPQVLVHRDYHSRNILVRDGEAPGVIDFQDAVRGPLTYDLVSLLRDCYIRWPRERVEAWALAYGNMAMEVGLLPLVKQATFLRWFDLMGLQRHIKVLGIFARLWLRDGKSGYLNDLPLVMRYTLDVAEAYPELAEFRQWFVDNLLPLAEQQDWYSDYHLAGEAQPGESQS
jgi:aminoglycoside/choline kinase family phosphotransferase